jgi:endoglucanase
MTAVRFRRDLRRAFEFAALFALVLLVSAAPAVPAGAKRQPGRMPGKLVPRFGALIGAFVNPTGAKTLSRQDQANLVLEFESMIGRKLDIEMWYYRWGSDFWRRVPRWDLANGRIPEVKYGAGGDAPSLDSIIRGSHDAEIRQLADGAKSLRRQFLFCPFWEMNGEWETWSGAKNNDPGTHNGPLKFVAAWRHMHDIFVRRRATNAVWVWAPNKSDVPRDSWNHWSRYYPGDRYVDWVGMDGYNWGTSAPSWGSRWVSFEEVFRPLYRDFQRRKPIMVAETASAEAGGSKRRWIADAAAAIKARFPDLVAVTWFDDNKPTETDWRVDSSPGSLSAYKAWVHDRYFNNVRARRRRINSR